jgi:hypothetical protein
VTSQIVAGSWRRRIASGSRQADRGDLSQPHRRPVVGSGTADRQRLNDV